MSTVFLSSSSTALSPSPSQLASFPTRPLRFLFTTENRTARALFRPSSFTATPAVRVSAIGYPDSQILGQTLMSKHHDELLQIGIIPSLKGMIPGHKFPYVIFCASPYQTPDYPGDVRLAVSIWNHEGCFLFTSSSSPTTTLIMDHVMSCANVKSHCMQDSPVEQIGRSPSTYVLLKAQQVALETGSCVVRLAGLYNENRGAHIYWLVKGTVHACPNHILNLIHFEDAATLSVCDLEEMTSSNNQARSDGFGEEEWDLQ